MTPHIAQLGAAVLVAYLVGSLPTAYLVGRVVKGIDLRRYGSGNVGASNAAVYMGGNKTLIGVGLFDLTKGLLLVVGVRWLGMGLETQALAGLAAVAGHNWSLYLRFAGGRGMSTAFGVLLGLGLPILVAVFAVFTGVGLLRREASLWMGRGVLLLPPVSLALGQSTAVVLCCTGLLALLGTKRVMANREPLPTGVSRWQGLRNRLLYDRDIRSREQWVSRTPSADDS